MKPSAPHHFKKEKPMSKYKTRAAAKRHEKKESAKEQMMEYGRVKRGKKKK